MPMNEKEMLLWAAHTLFEHGQTTCATGNVSLYDGEKMLISAAGSCFGTLTEGSLCCMHLSGEVQNGLKPSKEWPLHAMLHSIRARPGVVIHTHGSYTCAWSCLPELHTHDAIPAYTPYLPMKGGKVRLVPYAPPGSEKLFRAMEDTLSADAKVYLLAHHGAFVTASTAMEAFDLIEETEAAARMAFLFRGKEIPTICV